MASGAYNKGATDLQNRTIDWASDTIKVMPVKSSYTFDPDHSSMTTPTASELDCTGYTGGFAGADRKTLGSKTITQDDTNNRSVYDAADPSAWTLGGAVNNTIGGFIVYKHLTNDAGSTPIFFCDITDLPTNGSTVTLQFAATGINYLQNG